MIKRKEGKIKIPQREELASRFRGGGGGKNLPRVRR